MKSISEFHPAVTALYFAAAAGAAMLCMNPAVLCVSLLGALLLELSRGVRRGWRARLFSLGLFAVLALVNPLVSHNGRTVLFVVNGSPVTLEATLYGLTAAVMVTAVLCWFRTFSAVMTSDKLLCVFGGLSPKASLVLSAALRYVPLLRQRARTVAQAQRALGLYRQDTLPDRLRARFREFGILTTWVLQGGIITADSMAARGWGSGRRTSFTRWRFTAGDAALTALILLCAGTVVTAWALGALTWEFYPAVKPPVMTGWTAAGYAAAAVLTLIPLILQALEALKWKHYESKM